MEWALALVFVSAVLHPIRDICLKLSSNKEIAYLLLSVVWIGIAFFHSRVLGESLYIHPNFWWVLVVSAYGLSAYYFAVRYCTKNGDISIYYPIIRSVPLVVLLWVYFVWGFQYSWLTVMGILLTVLGIYLLAPKHRLLKLSNPLLLLVALLGMAGGATLSLADNVGMGLATVTNTDVPTPDISAWLFWGYIIICFNLFILSCLSGEYKNLINIATYNKRDVTYIIIASLTGYLSYALVLAAFKMNLDVTIATTLRQFSLLVSLVLAKIVLSEMIDFNRVRATVIILIGLVLVIGQY